MVVTQILPHSPPLEKCGPQPQLLPQLPQKSAHQPVIHKKKMGAISCVRRRSPKVTVNPLKPALVSKFLLVRGLAAGQDQLNDEMDVECEEVEENIIGNKAMQLDTINCVSQDLEQLNCLEDNDKGSLL
ncbi:hypothetical protein SK128_025401 [Halocaridina rubra]|uniref:Uncharacterized protein n=1 Tax=Halocaridina rubra TaxID=373956 RepID=A0AAN8WMM6_HALRR